ncbi:acyltransferase domain-containing protein [Nonomuraea sp. FMUSA5-5]|uniref:Acyltransferase domain-containing protein n=1 Tax=Nonomuraea composti TaxID=2720023 RepID=A0ABX1BLN5_9ACTN|nr:type I polyketide synthase [Nonomuraea sp. FMUSA5-5]NJP98651.1 acyltransferase domain-containing protein [Nonomuraea sp. FMUSA5-5]
MSVNGFGQEAVAIVGVGCRLPGGLASLDQLWAALQAGHDLVGQVPEERFEARRFVDEAKPRPGKSYTAAGGFLDDIAGFDADYFGISPREAAQIDPQHRLLLEMAAEALDDAGIDPADLAGSTTGAFIGISDRSYALLQSMQPEAANPYTMSGSATSLAANRLSHAFDLRGPSMAIDTACSSSLVALERACAQLCSGGSPVVLAGGVNLLLAPFNYIGFSQASMLSARGRCAAFSAEADGFVRAEGGALVVLKRLTDAVADGDRVHGVLVGWGSNCDGRTPGVARPSAQAQEDLLRQVYARAGVDPAELVYVEAHGTGTPTGDPVECQALGRALGTRRDTTLPIGSVKTNLGHLESASGMAGLLKALLVLRHGRIPANLHSEPLNPEIDFTGLNLAPVTQARQVTMQERAFAGVNSFGFGGANAHVIVAPAPSASPLAAAPGRHSRLPVTVSARSPQALGDAAARLAERLDASTGTDFYSLAFTSCTRRARHPHRLAVLADDPRQAAERLRAAPAAVTVPAHSGGRVAFVFCGNGAQWAGMGADLYAADEVFRQAVERADAALAAHLDWSVAQELTLPPAQWRLSVTEVAQPLLFAVQVGVTEMLAARGIVPAAVVGHSAGEVAAAWAAGALSLQDAAWVMAERCRAQAPTAGSGRMAAVGLPRAEAEQLLSRYPGVEVAGVNTDQDVTLAGPEGQLKRLGDDLSAGEVFFRMLELDYAFHSAAMDPAADLLISGLAGLTSRRPARPLISTVTGEPVGDAELDEDYWWRNLRRPVLFGPAVQRLLADGVDVFAEIGPAAVLGGYLRRLAEQAGRQIPVVATLRRGGAAEQDLDQATTTLIAAGAKIDWSAWFPRPGRVANLPAYPWQRRRHWQGTPQTWARSGGDGHVEHPLLGERMPAATPTWQASVEPALLPWLADHTLAGSAVLPGTAYIEMLLAAGQRVLDGPAELSRLRLIRPLVLDGDTRVQTSVVPQDGTVLITGAQGADGTARHYAQGRIRTPAHPRPEPVDEHELRARCRRLDADELYRSFSRVGLDYGPSFRVLHEVWASEQEVLAGYRHTAADERYTVHPALLDGAFQAVGPLLGDLAGHGDCFVPAFYGAVRLWRTPAARGWVRVRLRDRLADEACVDITVFDEDGTVSVQVLQARLRRFSREHTPLIPSQTVLRAAPHEGRAAPVTPLPEPARLAELAGEDIEMLRRQYNDPRYAEAWNATVEVLLHRFAWAFACLLPRPDAPFTIETLIAAGLLPRHRRLVEVTLPWLAGAGLAEELPQGQWRLVTSRARPDEKTRDLLDEHPAVVAEAGLAARTGRYLPAVLRGERDQHELLSQGGGGELLKQFYDLAPGAQFLHRVARALMRQIVTAWPHDRPLRILEVGAGTGGLSAALVPLLPADRTRYTFTDISPYFFAAARDRFAAYDFIDYRQLDMDADPAEQGFTAGGYDLVVAANALHAAEDLALALRHARDLLAPGGYLLLSEMHDARVMSGYFGTLDSSWRHTDTDVRPATMLLSQEQWPPLLRECGFAEVIQFGHDRRRDGNGLSVIVANRPPADPGPEPDPPPGSRRHAVDPRHRGRR